MPPTFYADQLPPPPKTESFQEQYRWAYRVFEILNGIRRIVAGHISVNPYGVVTSTDAQAAFAEIAVLIQDLQENLAETVVTETAFGQSAAVGTSLVFAREDHTHGTPVDPIPAHVAAADPHTQYLKETDATATYVPYTGANANVNLNAKTLTNVSEALFGSATDYSQFEADGTLKFNGAATVYNDINVGFAGAKVPAANAPTWVSFIGNLNEYRFAVDDYLQLSSPELLHDGVEGAEIEFHVHWATNGVNDATVRGVKWEIEFTWANGQHHGGTVVFDTPTVVSTETSIAAGEASLTHKYTSVTAATLTGWKIGAHIIMRIRRIASVTNPAPANDPFGIAVGIHYPMDTCGSRARDTK